MKKKLFLAFFVVLAVVLCAFTACKDKEPPETFTPRDDATVTIFTTNDMHGNLTESDKTIGVVQAAKIKASTPNALLVDAGDATQGASFASISLGADVVRMMNEADYDLMAAGNHEFDYGTDVLLENQALANFPILAANVQKNGQPLLESSVILEVANYKIGFIGLTTVSTATSTNPTLLTGVTFEDELQTAKDEIADLKDETDAIVLVCHMGDNDKAVARTSEQLIGALSAEERAEVSAVIDGHSHSVEDKTVQGVSIIQTGVNFTNLGKITLTFADDQEGANVTCDAEVLDYNTAMSLATTDAGTQKGEAVEAKLDEINDRQAEILNEVLCKIDHPLFGGYVCYGYVESRIVETAYGDFVTDAFKYYADKFAENEALGLPVIAVENGGGISQSLPTWYYSGTNVTVGDVLNAFNHGNLVEVLKVSPAQLFAAIEQGLVVTAQDDTGLLSCEKVSGSFLQCSGFSYTYDPAGETGNKVTEVKLADGTILDRNDAENKLLLATNNYVSSFFAQGEKVGELGGEDVLIKDYILYWAGQNDGVLDYDCNYDRIKIANDKSPDAYEVRIAVKKGAGETAQAQGNQTFTLSIDGGEGTQVTTDNEGFITVQLTKGAHYLWLSGGSNFVYVNNYSGTGIEAGNTKDGYYTFAFLIPQEA